MPDVLVEVRGDWLKGRNAAFLAAIEAGLSRIPDCKTLPIVFNSATCQGKQRVSVAG
jgi:hypothetical protein